MGDTTKDLPITHLKVLKGKSKIKIGDAYL